MNLNGERGQEHYRAVVAECHRIVDACGDKPSMAKRAAAYEALRAQLNQLRTPGAAMGEG